MTHLLDCCTEMLWANQRRFCITTVIRVVCGVGDSACATQTFHECLNIVLNIISAVLPRISYCIHELNECGLWEICAAIKRFCIRSEKYCHWPSTTTSHGLDGVHVNGVDVWSLFAVNFDIDEQLVHERSSFDIFKTFVGHYVAPVTRRIANRQKNRFSCCACESKSVFSPRIPIDRIVAMLAKVGADFVTEAIGHVRKR